MTEVLLIINKVHPVPFCVYPFESVMSATAVSYAGHVQRLFNSSTGGVSLAPDRDETQRIRVPKPFRFPFESFGHVSAPRSSAFGSHGPHSVSRRSRPVHHTGGSRSKIGVSWAVDSRGLLARTSSI